MGFRDLPIRRKLASVILVQNVVTLLVVCTTFMAYEAYTFRQSMTRDISTLAKVIATNSTAALAFDNADDATEVLAALKAVPRIRQAGIYDRNGHLFARYPADVPANSLPLMPDADGVRFGADRLTGVQAVVLGTGNQRLGSLYIESDLRALHERLQLYSEITLTVIAISIGLALWASWFLQRQISEPVLQLAAVAGTVSELRDYSVRAASNGRDEIGKLTDAFNHMLTQIEQQHRELSSSEAHIRAQLERLDLLHRITRAIGERQDFASIFQVLIRSLEDSLAIDFGCVSLYVAGAKELTVSCIGARGAPIADQLGLAVDQPIALDDATAQACLHGRLDYLPDLSDATSGFQRQLADAGLRSIVFAPLAVESRVFGVLLAAKRGKGGFGSADCEFLRQLSEHAALATHQAQLYGALQQAYDDLRQTQQSILQQERLRALGQMASGIAHDINNAISPVTLYTETLLEKEPNLSGTARRYLETIQRAIEDVAQTVVRMREFYRHRDSEMTLTPLDLNQLVSQVMDLTHARWADIPQQRGIVIETVMVAQSKLPIFMGAASEIREALTNLIFNAVDAMPEGGKLTLSTGAAGTPADRVYVEVSDTGLGMDEDTQRRCLEPFFTTKGERGTGLGLAMVYGMVQRHSAQIEINSQPGQGTRIRLLFLAAPSMTVNVLNQAVSRESLRPLRLLIVDDDPVVIASLRDTLESDGHLVTTADGGQRGIDEFIAALTGGRLFDAVLTDLGMPYVDGRKVAAAIKSASAATPIIMLTGWGQRIVAENDVPAQVDRVLNKPPKLNELRKALSDLCQPMITGQEAL